jgi:hypothetical protein
VPSSPQPSLGTVKVSLYHLSHWVIYFPYCIIYLFCCIIYPSSCITYLSHSSLTFITVLVLNKQLRPIARIPFISVADYHFSNLNVECNVISNFLLRTCLFEQQDMLCFETMLCSYYWSNLSRLNGKYFIRKQHLSCDFHTDAASCHFGVVRSIFLFWRRNKEQENSWDTVSLATGWCRCDPRSIERLDRFLRIVWRHVSHYGPVACARVRDTCVQSAFLAILQTSLPKRNKNTFRCYWTVSLSVGYVRGMTWIREPSNPEP